MFLWYQGNIEYGFNYSWITALMCISAVFSGWMLSYSLSKDGVSLRVIYWFYSFFFLGVVPVFQHSAGIWRFDVPDAPIPIAVFVILLSHIIFIIGYRKGEKQKLPIRNYDKPVKVRVISETKLVLCMVASIGITFSLVAAYGFNPSGSVVREAFGYQHGPLESVTEFLVRPTVFFFLLILIFRLREQKKTPLMKFALFLLFLNVLILIGPFSGNRSMIFFLYFGLLVMVYPPTPRKSFFYMFILVFGIVGSHFQQELRLLVIGSEFNAFSLAYLFQGHFDGFENLCHIISYIDVHGIVWGWQLIGVLFFYIPRILWAGKPGGSGDFIAWNYLDQKYMVFDGNIATPLPAEAFLNFHIVGVVAFMFFTGFMCAWLDKSYRYLFNELASKTIELWELRYKDYIIMIFYPVLLGLFLFILRGDLMSGTTFFTGMLVAFTVAIRLTTKIFTLQKTNSP